MNTAEPATPRPVRVAGMLVALQGVAGVALAAWLLATMARGSAPPVLAEATAAWLAGFGSLLLLVGAKLVRGRRAARTPALVAQLLLLGVCWYAVGPSSQPAYGIPAATLCLLVLVLLVCPPALRWATRTHRPAR
jgi:peptidoglycan/LPS O-acetylase OafA/YrhL